MVSEKIDKYNPLSSSINNLLQMDVTITIKCSDETIK